MDNNELLACLNRGSRNTMMETLEMRFIAAGADFLEAAMPVGPRVHQPMGILHGGATAALAETVGSAASAIRIDPATQSVVGLELAINHIRSARAGEIIARAEAVHLGRSTHLWSIRIRDHEDRLIAQAKLTMIVLERPAAPPTSTAEQDAGNA